MSLKIVLVGCGKMGGALLNGALLNDWRTQNLSLDPFWVVEADAALRESVIARGVKAFATLEELPPAVRPDVVVLAVKPQSMASVLPDCRRYVGDAVFLSIAAGKPIRWFQERLGPTAAIVRAMPNMPAAVRRGMTVLCANAFVTTEQKRRCEIILGVVSEIAWINDESLMDAVTAVSGSGPAYVFLLAESLAAAGVAAGLPTELAERLARATVAGSGELLHLAEESPAILRQNVTSPGGTTAAALAVLMAEDGLEPLLTRAIAAATARSRELAG